MESMLTAMQSKIVPLQEYYLQGSILDTSKDILLHRLRGICDNVESTTVTETFHDHEQVFSLREKNTPPLSLRARRSLDQPNVPWHLRYVGQPDSNSSKFTLVRSSIDVGTTDNLVQFLQEMGFKLDYEYVATGYLFRKGRMKITVYRVCRMKHPGNTDSVERMTSSYLVELSMLTVSGQDQVQEDMKNFAENLKPLVHLDKIEIRK